jgi:hypothetical protein
MRLNWLNILKMPGLARFGAHHLGAGLRRRFRTSSMFWRQDPDESRLMARRYAVARTTKADRIRAPSPRGREGFRGIRRIMII